MKPLVKWPGGKRREIEKIEAHAPENFDLFIEPFVGAGAVFFHLNPQRAVISDVHSELMNFYSQIAIGNGKEIHQLMSQRKNDEKTYLEIRDKFSPANDIERAFKFFYLRKTCYRGMLRYNLKGGFNAGFGAYKTFKFYELLDENYQTLLARTGILNVSFEEIFRNFDSENNFVFLDPPYDSEFTNYGYCKFGKPDHEKLAECFKQTKNKCLMIIGETDFIREIYKDYIADKYHQKYCFKFHSGRVGEEIDRTHLIVRNY
ncbi:MAG: Modification methylase CviBI [Candidatus Woesebacteria bacterium GW2011_GWB1_39_12]|uniref:site-specific DNA-methyltransferase (adenine-specific) n=1 Tax=Candidatus Woesebacteria bacterium GW2011_GWB1_39_12 TaxID=1618574 RepID=A0A0G0M9U8_9BACT|nr:MAG: Modification methylase CviBI [Candidatus Woesebacteria bacterium GW2011_GWB1_39_12]